MIDRVYQYSKSVDSCRICNKRQISRVKNNQPQFDIQKAVNRKNFHIGGRPYEAEREFSLLSLYEYLEICRIPRIDVNRLKQYIIDEEYDSDALVQDIEQKECNIHVYISSFCQTEIFYHLMKKFLNYDRFPTYKEGILMRYLVLRPKYFSLVKEVVLNDINHLQVVDWKHKVLEEVAKEYVKKSARSNVTDKRFGIEIEEPIGIHHLASIFLFTNGMDVFKQYRKDFIKSYWLWPKKIHANNFYWEGRYIYEAVQFYGKKFTREMRSEVFWVGVTKIISFGSIAPVFNSPTLTSRNMDIARSFAHRTGCILHLRPKYVGNIDKSKVFYAKLFNRNIRLVKGTKLQIKSIHIVSPTENLEPVVLAMQYIEKILTQTEFDAHFYNAKDLYSPKNMKNAYLLIMDKIGDISTNALTQYSRHIFDNWCFQREYITFETFRLEMNYMDYKLKE
eukprot:11642_1